jgi:hypothetical protein
MRVYVGQPLATVAAALALVLFGCASDGDAGSSNNGGSGAADNVASNGRGGGRMAAPQLADPVTVEGLVIQAPASWESATPSNSMRKAEYTFSGSGGEASCVLYFFGTGQGGSTEDNIERWIGQFEDPEGGNLSEKAERGTVENHGLTTTHVYVEGTMLPSPMMGQPDRHEDWAMLGAVVEGPGGPWFWKITGPEATVAEARSTFQYMMSELRAAG